MKIAARLLQGNRPILNRFVIQLLVIMFTVEFVKGALLIAILPVYMKETLALSAFLIGLTLALQYIGDNLFRSPVGWAVDKFGYRWVMLAGVLLTFTSVGIMVSFTHYGWIITACAILGVGTSPLWPCVVTGATESAGEKALGSVMSIVYLSWITGTGLGPIVINLFIAETYHTAFRILIVLMVIASLTAMFLPRRYRKPVDAEQISGAGSVSASESGQTAGERFSLSRQWGNIRRYFREAYESLDVSLMFYAGMFAQTMALGLLIPVLTLYARTVLNLTPNQYSLFLLAGGAVTAVFMLPAGKLVDRFGTRPFLLAGFLAGGAALILFTYSRSMPYLLVMVSLLGAAFACIIPAWNAFIGSYIPKEKRGAIWGFFLTIEGSGTVTGSVLSGVLWDGLGYGAPFIASGCVLLCLWVAQVFVYRDRIRAEG
jgi:MFS transporter, DHA1 family, multidrug resistance protein